MRGSRQATCDCFRAGFEDGGGFERRSLVRRGVQAAVEVSVLVGGVAVEGGWRHHRVSALPSRVGDELLRSFETASARRVFKTLSNLIAQYNSRLREIPAECDHTLT